MRVAPVIPASFLAVFAACGSDTGADPTATMVPVGNMGEVIAATKEGISAFVHGSLHLTWVKEAEVHESSGPHGMVRSYFNDKYLGARRTDQYPMPVGAMSVKELVDGDGIDGFAIAIKTQDGPAPESWTWFESVGGNMEPKYFGVANPTCENCHKAAANKDRSLTPSVP